MNPKNLKLATELRRELHTYPELSNKEVETKKRLIDFLKKHTTHEIVDKGRWFYAIYRAKEGKGNIAFRADFDAIAVNETMDIPHRSKNPGVSHKCGHDGHTAALAGLALEIEETGADRDVFFLFQHAEETADGAIECTPFIKEHGIEEIFGAHNAPDFQKNAAFIRNGTVNCASKGMIISMKGTPAHASTPEDGRNPAFAIAEVVRRIPEFIAPEKYRGMVLCTVIQIDVGEEAFGVSASEGRLLLTLRGLYEVEMDCLQAEVEKAALLEAEKHGLECSFDFRDSFPETANHDISVEKVRLACKNAGIPILEMEEARRGSEDYGYFTKLIPGAYFYVGAGEDCPPVHTVDYDYPDDILETTVEAFKALVRL